jgi:type I restriction-modification system DNA methylase subunit
MALKKEFEGSSTGTGSLYEFFTPDLVVKKMWELAYMYGFNKDGYVLEPASGDGRMIKYAPNKSKVVAFEINKENIERLKLEYPEVTVFDKSFETAFLEEPRFNSKIKSKVKPTWIKQYPFDLVIANPPYGKYIGYYSTYFNFNGQFEHFFIEYTMKLVKKGGLGVFLVPSSFMRNGSMYNSVKSRILAESNFVDAYRLPANIFAKTGIGTDIIVFRKK